MSTKLTIILFLKERKNFNKRFIDYFCENNLNFNLLISDGSKKKIDKNLLKQIKKNRFIEYFKFPEDKSYAIYYQKIYKTLKLVKTKYVFFASNDDFIIYKTLKKCVDFLTSQNKYIGCGGTMIGFEMLKKNNLDFKLSNFHNLYKGVKLDHVNSFNRFNHFLKNYCDHPKNCVMKKNIFLDTYKHSSNLFQNNIEFKDHFSCLHNVISGRIKDIKKPLILHQSHLNSEGNFRSDILKSTFVNSKFINNLIIFDKILSSKLKIPTNIVMNKYYSYVLKGLINTLNLKREPSLSEIKSIFIKKFQRRLLKKKSEKTIYFNFNILDKDTKETIFKIEKNLINKNTKNLND